MLNDIIEAKGAQALTNHLTAKLVDGEVEITGDKARVKLPSKSGPHKFKFHLDDDTGLNVRFSGFGAQIGETCPADPGDNTNQIDDLDISDKKAEFTDRNSGPPVTFGYAWFFTCDDPKQRPTFDPIVDNGGDN